MKLTDFFIKRPVLAIVVNLIILVAGYQSIRSLSVRQFPRSDMPVITITTTYIGASADLVRGYVTTPIERAIASVDGIDYIKSSSVEGSSTITVNLKLNQNPNATLTQLQTKLAQTRNDLPPEAESPVIVLENTDDRQAAMYLSFSSTSLDQNKMTDFLTRVIQPMLTTVPGIQRADILGARVFAMRIWLKPDRLAALRISATEVCDALRANNYNAALGKTKGAMTCLNLTANTNLTTAEEFKQLVIKQKGNILVHLQDVADVELGAEDYDSDVRFDGKSANFIGIWCLPTANVLEVLQQVRKEIPKLRQFLPAGVKLDLCYDSSRYIQDAIHEVTHTLLETLGIVVLVIFLFLGSLRSMLIPLIAIPVSLIGAALIMMVAGFSINLLTLLAIVLAVGLVVDDAIVIVENVERHLQHGLSPLHAAVKGARELVGPIIAMTITLAAVYTPLGIQGGLTGALFREFAFTLAGAVFISGVVALTLSPMMSSRLLRKDDQQKGYAAWVHHRFAQIQFFYERLLAKLLNYRAAILAMALCWMALLPFLYFFSPKELAPLEDQGFLPCFIQASPNATLDQVTLYMKSVSDVLGSIPETDHFFQYITFTPQVGFAGIITKPWNQRKRTTQQISEELAEKTAAIPGLLVAPFPVAPLPGSDFLPVDFVISSTAEPRHFLEDTQQLIAAAYQSGLFTYVDDDLKYDQPQLEVSFDRNKVSALGLDLQKVGADLGALFSGNYVNRFTVQGLSYKVIPQIKREDRLNPDQLKKIYVAGPKVVPISTPDAKPEEQLIQLSAFATFKQSVQPRQLQRFQQLNSVTISGVLAPNVTLDQALKMLEKKTAEIFPSDYKIDYEGESRQLRREGNSLLKTLALSLLFIFLVISAQFESFRDPCIVLFGSVPLALSGALLFTFFGLTTINIYSQIGLITLVGLVAKNGILIVQFANHLQMEGASQWDAIIKAASTRLRPVLMTSVATVAGHFPLILARGPGAGARNSIGIILVTGMMIGTFFTLFVLPSIYLLLSKKKVLTDKHYLHGGALEQALVLE
ncbi:MAG: efflux RND transporter permease subunit [Chthoniobacterales bacterium]|nr:efflux RND transporter permease subunit [Chthoniobacterales bacterium]